MNWIWVWLGIVVVALVLEFITMELVSIWFAFGGFVSLIMSACGASVASQWIVFGLLSKRALTSAIIFWISSSDNLTYWLERTTSSTASEVVKALLPVSQ